MDRSNHFKIETLFAQLGLKSEPSDIADFFENHHLSGVIRLDEAPFWTASQADFLREAIEQDSDWAEVVDQLDSVLRH